MENHRLPKRLQSTPGPGNATQQSKSGNPLASTRALILTHDQEHAKCLQGRLGSLGIEVWEATCASGAAAVLRRGELRGRPIDFLLIPTVTSVSTDWPSSYLP